MIDRRRLREELAESGLRPGMSVIVHCSMARIGWIKGGAKALREAMLEVLGEDGTLVVPTQSRSKSQTSNDFLKATEGLEGEDFALYLKRMRGFEQGSTPSEHMGALAESVRKHPQALRSPHPTTSFAAIGRHAVRLCTVHPLESLVGRYSPLGALRDIEGSSVLLLGVGYDKCTAFHLGEEAAFQLERPYRCKIGDEWRDFQGFPHVDEDFAALGAAFEAANPVDVRHGMVGEARTLLFPLALAADYAAKELPALRFAR